MHIQIYIYLCTFRTGSYLKNTQRLNKYVFWVNFLGKPAMGFSAPVAQTCVNGTRKIKHLSENKLLLPFPACRSHTESHWGQIRWGLDEQIILGLTDSPEIQETCVFNPICVISLCCNLIYHFSLSS